jgi:hypothetical protein
VVTVQQSRIQATLLVQAYPGRTDQELRLDGSLSWEPARPDRPILVTKGVRTVTFLGSSAPVTVGGTPYPSELRGLIHTIGTSNVFLTDRFYLKGTLLADGTIQTSGFTAVAVDPELYRKPSDGYTKGDQVKPTGGTWRWDSLPAAAAAAPAAP